MTIYQSFVTVLIALAIIAACVVAVEWVAKRLRPRPVEEPVEALAPEVADAVVDDIMRRGMKEMRRQDDIAALKAFDEAAIRKAFDEMMRKVAQSSVTYRRKQMRVVGGSDYAARRERFNEESGT